MLHTSYSMCMYIPSACFSGSVIHLMSTTQLDRSRSPTMPCILLVYISFAVGSLPLRLANNTMHSPSWRAGASQPSRTTGSDFSITGAAHTNSTKHKIATSLYSALETDIEGRCVSLQKARRKRRLDYPDADRARRAAQSSQATKNCRGSETAEASVETEIEERGVSIQKAWRKRRHDYPARR